MHPGLFHSSEAIVLALGSPSSAFIFQPGGEVALVNTGLPVCDAYRFDAFEVRIRPGILLREGQRVRIQDLTFRMLVILLETPDTVVTRQELQKKLWGDEVDHGLHVVVARLREALGDQAAEPRFIKTVSGQGFRFIGNAVPLIDTPPEAPTRLVRPIPLVETERTKRFSRRILVPLITAVVVVTLIAVVAGTFLYRYERRPLIEAQDKVVVGGFSNGTSEHDLDTALFSAFRVKLEESPYLNLVPEQQFRQLIREPDVASLKDELRACSVLNGQILLRGEIRNQSQGYLVLVQAWRSSGGRLAATQQAFANSRTDILAALNFASEEMRQRMGEPENSLKKFNVPLSQSTTDSLAALHAFNQGEENRLQGRDSQSIANYKLAIDLDPQFALAWARLGTVYFNGGEHTLARVCSQKAFDLRARATDRERLYIISHYYFSTGEIQRSIDANEMWHSLYPRDAGPVNSLAVTYTFMGQPEKAVEMARKATQMEAAPNIAYANLAQAFLRAGDYASLQAMCDDSMQEKTEASVFHLACYDAAFVRNDPSGMQRQMDWAHGTTEEYVLLDGAARVAMYHGKMLESRRLFSEARQSALRNNGTEAAAEISLDEADFEADLGLKLDARQNALAALKLAPDNTNVQAFAAIALAQTGDFARSEAEAAKAASQSPLDTVLNSAELATVHATVQMGKHEPESAIRFLESARPFDSCIYMELAPGYYRGLAYLAANRPDRAAIEFRRVVDHRTLSPASPYVVLAELQLGRALQLSGNRMDAARVYGEVESIWKDADSDFLPLRELHTYQKESDSQHTMKDR